MFFYVIVKLKSQWQINHRYVQNYIKGKVKKYVFTTDFTVN